MRRKYWTLDNVIISLVASLAVVVMVTAAISFVFWSTEWITWGVLRVAAVVWVYFFFLALKSDQ